MHERVSKNTEIKKQNKNIKKAEKTVIKDIKNKKYKKTEKCN
jgi:hypothetical protein